MAETTKDAPFVEAYKEANKDRYQADLQLLKTLQDTHNSQRQKMEEHLRMLNNSQQQMLEQKSMLQQYYPEYGKQLSFVSNAYIGAITAGAGYGGLKLAQLTGRGIKGTAAMALGAATLGLGVSSLGFNEIDGTENSRLGSLHREHINTFGPMDIYTTRSAWQDLQGNVLSPDSFKNEIAMPSNNIAQSWNINPAQFLPGALDLMRQGIVAPASSETGRSFRTALKEAAEIFKAVQSFFGSVDIAGLSAQIKQLQQAGFTPENMTSLGRAMQASTLAFAPDNIKQEAFSNALDYGTMFSQKGYGASYGGLAALQGFTSGYSAYGNMTDYQKTIFRTPEELSQSFTNILASSAINPITAMGAGDPMAGLQNILSNYDMLSRQGQREFKKAQYELTANMSASDQYSLLTKNIDYIKGLFPNLDEETAAEIVLKDPKSASAYMLFKKSTQDTLSKNINLFRRSSIAPVGSFSENNLTKALQIARDFSDNKGTAAISALSKLGSGRSAALRRLVLSNAYQGLQLDNADLTTPLSMGGYFDSKVLRKWSDEANYALEWSDDNIASVIPGRAGNMWQRLSNPQIANISQMLTGIEEGYSTKDLPSEFGNNYTGIRSEMALFGAELSRRLKEERLDTNRGIANVGTVRNIFSSLGMTESAAYVGNDARKLGVYLRAANLADRELEGELTQNILGISSVSDMYSGVNLADQKIASARPGSTGLRMMSGVFSNPIVGSAMGLIAGGAAAVATGGAGFMGGFTLGMGGSILLGKTLGGLNTLSSDYLSEQQASDINASAYGVNVVIGVLKGLIPESFLSRVSALMESYTVEKLDAVKGFTRLFYGKFISAKETRRLTNTNMRQVVQQLCDETLSDLQKTSSNPMLAELTNGIDRNKLIRAGHIIGNYVLNNTDVAPVVEVAEAVTSSLQEVIESPLSDSTNLQDINFWQNALENRDPAALMSLSERGAMSQADQFKRTAASNALKEAISNRVRSAGGESLTNKELATLQTKIMTAIHDLPSTAGEDEATAAVAQSLNELGYDSGNANRLVMSIKGLSDTIDKSSKMSKVAEQVINSLLQKNSSSRKIIVSTIAESLNSSG